jgi:hypothetical protein
MNLERCSKVVKDKNIPVKENQRKFTIVNEQGLEITKIQVDGCLEIDGVKCDWMFTMDNPPIEIYVELKGRDVKHAFKQLENTIKVVSRSNTAKRFCYVVASKCPLSSPDIQNQQKAFKRDYNATLRVRNKSDSVNIADLILPS